MKNKLKINQNIIIATGIVLVYILVIAIIIAPKNSSEDMQIFSSEAAQLNALDSDDNSVFLLSEVPDGSSNFFDNEYFINNASYEDGRNIRLTSGVRAVTRFKTDLPYICITFDDCPSGDMEGIFDALAKYNMRATFFINGIYVLANPGYLNPIIEKGHTIGNHTFSHVDLTQVTTAKYRYQINSVDEMVFEETGIHTTLFRPPFGRRKWDYLLTKYTEVMWSIESRDSFVGPEKTFLNATAGEQGSIILFHTASIDAQTLERICKYYYDIGLTSIPVEEMLAKNVVEKEGLQILESMEYYIK